MPEASEGESEPVKLEGRKSLHYRGLEPKHVYSKSLVDQAHSQYVLEPALQGDLVHHEFMLRNGSQEVLELVEVKGCSGCIMESYSRRIQPGRAGTISILIPTDSRGGQEVNGTIRVKTDDASQPLITIDVSLRVKEFASLAPYRVWLRGSSAEDLAETCIVIPNEDYPFSITGIVARKGVWFTHSYKEIVREGRKGYEIAVRNTRKKLGSYQDVLFVQTDNRNRPEFKIRVEGRIHE